MIADSPPPIPAPAHDPNAGLATASMVCGILAPFTCLATALPAIITGHISLSRNKHTGGPAGNAKKATWGLILGYGSFLLIPIIAALAGVSAPLVMRAQEKGKLVECSTRMVEIGTALREFNTENGTDTEPFPADLRQLESLGLITDLDRLLTMSPGNQGDWAYFSAADSEDASAPLLLSPPIRRKQILLRTDGSTLTISTLEGGDLIRKSLAAPTLIPSTKKSP